MTIIDKLRENMVGKKFCSDINNSHNYVSVINVCKANRGYQVLFKSGDDGKPVFCAYSKFIKRYPFELEY